MAVCGAYHHILHRYRGEGALRGEVSSQSSSVITDPPDESHMTTFCVTSGSRCLTMCPAPEPKSTIDGYRRLISYEVSRSALHDNSLSVFSAHLQPIDEIASNFIFDVVRQPRMLFVSSDSSSFLQSLRPSVKYCVGACVGYRRLPQCRSFSYPRRRSGHGSSVTPQEAGRLCPNLACQCRLACIQYYSTCHDSTCYKRKQRSSLLA